MGRDACRDRESEPDRMRHSSLVQPGQVVVAGYGAVGADEDPLSWPGSVRVRQLCQCFLCDTDMIGGRVRAGVAWPKQCRDGFAGPVGTVVGERQPGMKSESALVGRSCRLLLRVGGDEGRVEVDDDRVLAMMSIAVSTAGASANSAAIRRHTVGSKGTFPNTAVFAQVAMSARQSPPNASDTRGR